MAGINKGKGKQKREEREGEGIGMGIHRGIISLGLVIYLIKMHNSIIN